MYIRPMTAADRQRVIQIIESIPEFKTIEVPVAKELVDSYLANPHTSGYYILVAEVDSSIAGYICYGPTPLTIGTWDIYWIAVDPNRQRQGIGKALYAYTEDGIKKDLGRMIMIETSSSEEYENTRRFHKSQGYQVVCQISDFYAVGDDKLVLRKIL